MYSTCLLRLLPPRATLFPYTTLFRSRAYARILELARRFDVPVVATNDVHYLHREDAAAHEVLLCIQTGKTLDDPSRMRFEGDRKSTRLNSSHVKISYAVFCLKKKKTH